MGARTWADGPDSGGFLSSPAGRPSTSRLSELHYPLRYLWRRERPDSGGPGRYRGGVGADNAYVLHHADRPFASTVFAHGLQPPTASGTIGGEPGTQQGFLVVHDGRAAARSYRTWDTLEGEQVPLPPKIVGQLGPDDVYVNWCSGGGGFGDPLDRPPAEVLADVVDGLVSVHGAVRDHAVVVRSGGASRFVVDEEATAGARASRRRTRLGGREPAVAAWSAHPRGRRVSATLEVVGGEDGAHGSDGGRSGAVWACRSCGTVLGLAEGTSAGPRDHLVMTESSVAERWPIAAARPGADRFVVRRYACPGCAVQSDVEVALAGEPPLAAVELLDPPA